jgi:hypothetical protein
VLEPYDFLSHPTNPSLPICASKTWGKQEKFADQNISLTGTTYSCVATYEGNNVEIIANEQGSFTTPSFVSFTDKERLIGEAAKNNAAMNPRNTVFDAKCVLLPS